VIQSFADMTTAGTALRLAQLFKTTPQFWMHMQANCDLKAAMARRRATRLAARS
jgi:addiction module HigA family antidote